MPKHSKVYDGFTDSTSYGGGCGRDVQIPRHCGTRAWGTDIGLSAVPQAFVAEELL
jgi:hypothetical protein